MSKNILLLIYTFSLLSITDIFANNINIDYKFDEKIIVELNAPCIKEEYNKYSQTNNNEETNKTQEIEEEIKKNIDNVEKILNKNKIVKSSNYNDENTSSVLGNSNSFVLKNILNSKTNEALSIIYDKIIKNLNFIKLFDVKYNSTYCSDANKYLKEDFIKEEKEYVFSNAFIKNDFVLTANIETYDKENIKLKIFLWDTLEKTFIDGKYFIFALKKENYNLIANKISDLLFKVTTGETSGIFDSKIIYVSETGNALEREKQISMINFDGTENKEITKGKEIKLTPIFSKIDKNEIFFVQKQEKEGFLIVKSNLETKVSVLIKNDNMIMSSAPNFSPIKNEIILAGTDKESSTNLYIFDFETHFIKQLTYNNNINTSPSFNPDGNKIVYVSDETGVRKLYIMDLITGNEKLLTLNAGIYDKPSWSPDGKLIAFVKLSQGKFLLGLIGEGGEGERYLIDDYLIEGIRWSPNSRYLIYTKQKGIFGKDSIPRLYVIDIVTGYEFMIQTPENVGASGADWVMN